MDRICLIGDSITHGTGDETLLGWPGIVFKNKLPTTIYNIGVRADTSELILIRWLKESKARLPKEQQGGLIFSFWHQ
jgi:lysophospholipase L1-like esterase